MRRTARHFGVAVIALLLSTAAGQAQPGSGGAAGADYRASVERAARELARQIEWLQDALYNEPQRRQGRSLWNSSEKVNEHLLALQRQLRAGASRKDVYVAFGQLDTRVQELLSDLRILGEQDVPLRRAAARVLAAEQDLHFAIAAGDSSEDLHYELLRSQTLALGAASQDLDTLGKYLFHGQETWTNLSPDLRNLRQAAAAFQKSLEGRPERQELLRPFAKLEKAWQDLTVDYSLLPRTSSLLLQNYAARLDVIYGRLYDLVGVKGTRTKLVGGS